MTAAVPETMRAAVLHAPGDLRIEERRVREPEPGHVMIKIGSVGLCGSDVHYFRDGRSGSSTVSVPTVLGHEFGGTVVAAGPGVAPDLVGTRVAVEPGLACGDCRACASGSYNHCQRMHFYGAAPIDGAMQQYLNVAASQIFSVPDNVSDDAAALIEPLSVALWALHRAHLSPGDTVLVTGAGPVGILTVGAALAGGVRRVIVVEPNTDRLRFVADEYPAAIARSPSAYRAQHATEEIDVIIECSGSAHALVDVAAALRHEGRIVLVGVGPKTLSLQHDLLQEREITVVGSHRYRRTWPRAIELVAAGSIDVDALVTHAFDLEHVGDALEALGADPTVVKAVIRIADPDLSR